MEPAKKITGPSIVKKLLKDIADPTVSVAALLRTAKIIATKLGGDEALVWINRELDGYLSGEEEFPPYRRLSGTLRAFNPYGGWLPIIFPDPEAEEILSAAPLGSSIGSLEQGFDRKDRKNTGGFAFNLTPVRKVQICQAIGATTEVRLDLDAGHLYAIIDKVRNLLLDWALGLEKAGVAGLDMDFTDQEKKEATAVTHQFVIQNVGVLGNVTDQANITNNLTAAVSLDMAAITAMVQQARAHLGSLPIKQKAVVEPVLTEIEAEVRKDKPDGGVIRELLKSARTICEGATGNLAATGVVGMITSILG